MNLLNSFHLFFRHLLTLLFIGLVVSVMAQAPGQKATIFDEATVIYKESIYGGVMLHTNGYGAHISYGKNKTAFKSTIYQLDFIVMRHPKEVRSFNAFNEDSRSYIFGKLNSFFILRPSIGNRVLKYDKIRPSGVAVGYSWSVGPSLGFTKPVYLEVLIPEIPPFQRIVVERASDEVFQNLDIYGRAGGLRGFNEINFQPGLHGSFAINFDYDPEREGLKGLELGLAVDYFPFGEVEIMSNADNASLFVNLFVALQFGKKFNR
jgi:hypothetical protein